MISTHDILRNRLLERRGLVDPPPSLKDKGFDLEKLYKSQWSDEFEERMRNRLVMGAMRYGLLQRQALNEYDNIGSILRRAERFKTEQNKELLVDIANLALVEYVTNTEATFRAEDDGEHVTRK